MKKRVLLILVAVIVVILVGVFSAEHYTSRPSFCGSCHIMEPYYNSWEKSKHGQEDIACVDCHYAPGEQGSMKAKFKGLGQLFSYLGTGDELVQKSAFVNDLSCTTSDCHPTTGKGKEGEYWGKKVKFTEYKKEGELNASVSFTHEPHYDSKKWVEGQEMHCSTCHRHESGKKHMEVSADICNLCHFKNTAINEKRAKCSLCHVVPEEPFKKSDDPDETPVTHKTLEERKVSCAGCHLELTRGTGAVRPEECLDCHWNEDRFMKDAKNLKLMHEKHVAAQTAGCFNCHEPIDHRKEKEYTYADAGLADCRTCHAEPHMSQRQLIAGKGGIGVKQAYPIKHHVVRTNCIACHTRDAVNEKGNKIKAADSAACVSCHTEKEGRLIDKWQEDVADFLEEAREIEQEAVEAITGAEGSVPDSKIEEAKALLESGRKNLRLVASGGGVHNKKYSVLLLDIAIEKFEDAIYEVE